MRSTFLLALICHILFSTVALSFATLKGGERDAAPKGAVRLGDSPLGETGPVLRASDWWARGYETVRRDDGRAPVNDGNPKCSKDKPCKYGCCGGPVNENGEGECASGPKACGEDCIWNCDYKSECDPGWGLNYSMSSTCPINSCCSQYGNCGVSAEFCKSRPPNAPSCPTGESARQKRIGYYLAENWTRECGLQPEQIPFSYYTHINFAFAVVSPETFSITGLSDETASLYKRVLALKKRKPDLQVWITLGGGAMVDRGPWQDAFSTMIRSEDKQNVFLQSLMSFMHAHGFDGVDIDWEYPVMPANGGHPEDYDGFVAFAQKLRRAIDESGRGYGFSIALPTAYTLLKGFNVAELAKSVDWFNYMTYDFHGPWDAEAPELDGRAYAHTNITDIDEKLDMLWRNDVPPEKVVMGLAFYGRSFTLEYADCQTAGCPFSGPGIGGRCTGHPGILSTREIIRISEKENPKIEYFKSAAVKGASWNQNQWVSFDDADTLKTKMEYASARCLSGLMVWSIDLDDGILVQSLV